MLPAAFLSRPIAHRALHDITQGRPENSRAAAEAAIAGGYGIEIDLQLSSDGQAMVFHDYDLGRLTGETGAVRLRCADDLRQIPLLHGNEGIPSFAEFLALVDGRVPLLVELKDQDGALGTDLGPLERAVAADLAGYAGDVAVMSFNPHSVAALAVLAPDIPRGLTTCAYTVDDFPTVPAARRAELEPIPDFTRTGSCFISHHAQDLHSPHVAALKAQGVPVLCWTIRSPEAEAEARQVAENVTFEGYAA
jgi:glycerophosphoryl diester phosphodiesterase